MSRVFDTVVIGAGIAGLTVAAELATRGRRVAVLERSDTPGGAIRTVQVDGFLVEEGPNSLLDTSPEVADLLARVGLADRRVFAQEAAKKRYVVRGGRPVALPMSPGQFFSSPLFSTRAKLGLLLEPFRPPWDNRYEESVAGFVRRRLGSEFLDYAINPFVAGVYAGDPETLSVPHAFPKLHRLEQRYGSLIKGQILGARERKRRAESSKQSARMYSFAKGLAELPHGLARHAGEHLVTGAEVRELGVNSETWTVAVEASNGERHRLAARSIVYTGRLTDLTRIRWDGMPTTLPEALSEVVYPPVTVLGLGYRADQVAHPLDGFGVLVPEVEKKHVLGVLFSSTLFPGRAPDNHVLLTLFVGGTRQPDLALLDLDELLGQVREDLNGLLDVKGEPVMVHRCTWNHAIPQYKVGYGLVKGAIESLEAGDPGLFFAGNYRDGISVPDTIKSSLGVAGRIEHFLTTLPP